MTKAIAESLYINSIFEAAAVDAANELVKLIHSADPHVALEACREVLNRAE